MVVPLCLRLDLAGEGTADWSSARSRRRLALAPPGLHGVARGPAVPGDHRRLDSRGVDRRLRRLVRGSADRCRSALGFPALCPIPLTPASKRSQASRRPVATAFLRRRAPAPLDPRCGGRSQLARGVWGSSSCSSAVFPRLGVGGNQLFRDRDVQRGPGEAPPSHP